MSHVTPSFIETDNRHSLQASCSVPAVCWFLVAGWWLVGWLVATLVGYKISDVPIS